MFELKSIIIKGNKIYLKKNQVTQTLSTSTKSTTRRILSSPMIWFCGRRDHCTFMTLIFIFLYFCLSCHFLPVQLNVRNVNSRIYNSLDSSNFCFRRFNQTHQIGCSSKENKFFILCIKNFLNF